MKSSQLTLLALSFLTFEAVAATRTREQARQQTNNLTVASAEVLEQFGATPLYPSENTEAIKGEIESCGLNYNGTACLDSNFENFGNAGVKDVDTTDKSGYVFFSRFKMKKDPRILLMAIIANKSDCVLSKTDPRKCEIDPATRQPKLLPAFRTGNIWAITPGREKPETYITDFLKCTETEDECMLRPLLAYDPSKNREETAINDLEGVRSRYADDFRRFFHAAEIASGITNKTQLERAVTAISKRSEVVTKSKNPAYINGFFSLIQTRFSKFPELVVDVAREVVATAPAGSVEQLQATIIAVRNGDTSASSLKVLATGFANTRLATEVRKTALTAYARAAKTTADQDKVLALLASNDQVLRSGAYAAVDEMELTDANLPALEKVLTSTAPNMRGNGVKALSKIETIAGAQRLGLMMKDKSVDVALSAATYVQKTLNALTTFTEVDFIFFMENTTLAAQTAARDARILTEDLAPAREKVLRLVFGKVKAKEQVMLAALKKSAVSRLVSVRVDAIRFIAQLKLDDATTALIQLLTDTNVTVNAALMEALNARLLTDKEVDLLFKTSINPDVLVRRSAVALIAKVSSKKALQALLVKSQENIDASSWKVRMDVANLLGAIYTAETTSALFRMLTDTHAEVRTTAFTQLAKGDRLFDDAQVGTLQTLLQTGDAVTAERAAILLCQVNTETSVAILTGMLNAPAFAAQQLPLVKALGAVNSVESTALLITALASTDPEVKSLAQAALTTRELTVEQTAEVERLLGVTTAVEETIVEL